MGFNAVDKTASGRAIAELLNAVTIECDGYFDVVNVGYADSTDEIVLNCVSGDYVIIPRETLACADWDEDHNDQPLYVVQDNMDVTHILKFYRNDSLEIMRQVKEKF